MLASESSAETHWDHFLGLCINITYHKGVVGAIAHGWIREHHILKLKPMDDNESHLVLQKGYDLLLPHLTDVGVTFVQCVHAHSYWSWRRIVGRLNVSIVLSHSTTTSRYSD